MASLTPAERGATAALIVFFNTWVLIPPVWAGVTADSGGLRFMAWSAALLTFTGMILAVAGKASAAMK